MASIVINQQSTTKKKKHNFWCHLIQFECQHCTLQVSSIFRIINISLLPMWMSMMNSLQIAWNSLHVKILDFFFAAIVQFPLTAASWRVTGSCRYVFISQAWPSTKIKQTTFSSQNIKLIQSYLHALI